MSSVHTPASFNPGMMTCNRQRYLFYRIQGDKLSKESLAFKAEEQDLELYAYNQDRQLNTIISISAVEAEDEKMTTA